MARTSLAVLILAILTPIAGISQGQEKTYVIEAIQIVRISSEDERATVRTPDGKIQVIKVGDSIGERGKVIEIVEGRIVIEERTDKGPETVIIRFENGKQRIERIRKAGGRQPILYAPK